MDFSIPIAGLQNASAAFDSAARGLAQAFNQPSAGAPTAPGDSVDLSTTVAGLLKSKIDFMANVNLEVVENSINQSTFSLLG